ncbi:hypothetical protein BBP40_012658 [Aspergillus hancockii]|nr:hypothetical protein BBP40_012658 [Aspergillus hancockii]
MSNQAPTSSFGGPAKYTQQWHGSNPSSSSTPSSLPHNLPFNQNQMPTFQQLQEGFRYPFDYNEVNFNANSHLPGLGAPVPAGSLPPPPFPFGNFAPSQFPPPFPLMQMPPMRYPPMPVPHASINTPPSRPLTSDFQSQSNLAPMNNAHPQLETSTISKQDMDREEGELTDMEGASSQQGTDPRGMSLSSSGRGPQRSTNFQTNHSVNGNEARTGNIKETASNNDYVPKGSRCVSSEVEEGEASSPGSRSSSRDSGSPYNPPISVSAEPFIAVNRINDEVATPKLLSQCLSAKSTYTVPPTESQAMSNSGKSPAQLRVQAQGALLSLAPHNIRYSELVGEGINPVILKQLYEEVGIKVPTPQPDAVSDPVSASPSMAHDFPVTNHTASTDTVREQGRGERQAADAVRVEDVAQSSGLAEAAVPSASSSQPGTVKPMERKEVIARMLAAKAAKSLGAPASPQRDVVKEIPTSDSSPTTDFDKPTEAASSTESLAQDKEVRVREKNKAKTELARQRIEQLKKQGLMRAQQKSIPDTMPVSKVHENTKTVQDSTPSSNSSLIQHPLPERPPDPESGAFARIPGLFMAEVPQTSPNEPSMTPTQVLLVDSTPQPRINQRKRPRASDFDEPISMPKKALNNGVNNALPVDRLVIDISDDDLYEDDENDDMEIETLADNTLQPSFPDGHPRAYLAESLPSRPVTSLGPGFSLSSTPQNSRNNDQEDLRKKDLEIQAMHKRIAELEQRKKAKLAASRTQSPRVVESSESTPLEGSTPADTPERDPSQMNVINNLSKATVSSQSPSIAHMDLSNFLDSMDAEQLEIMRSKVLRKQEIESGVPALDEEIRKSETRLADFNFEQEKLLLEITRGKEGRKQLLEELRNLSTELSGVSLEDVESALVRLKNKAQESANEASALQPSTSDGDEIKTPDTAGATFQHQEGTRFAQEAFLELPANTVVHSHLSNIAVEQDDVLIASRESTPTSSSDSSGSAMDESSDSDSDSDDEGSDGSDSADEESKAQSAVSDVHMSEVADEIEETNQAEAHQLSEELRSPLPERRQSTNTENHADMSMSSGEQPNEMTEDQASDYSMVSETYEPPEPEANASPANSAYTPPFSPASPGPIEPTELRSPVQESENAGEPPMVHVQDTGVTQSGEDTQNSQRPGDSEHKFSPYVSPLKVFKAYRYHPNYTDDVTGGYRSLTYSHNIDPMVYLCPFEGAGGLLTSADDKILVQMGSLREGKTTEEKDSYITGLKNIINDMRRDKVKDFSTVATEIAAYRRRFLQDPSRVLPL